MLAGVSPSAFATNYYVNDGSKTNDVAFPGCSSMGVGSSVACGSCSVPCDSPQRAYDDLALTAGDIVYINSGTYNGTTAGNPVFNLANAAKSGTSASARLTFTGPLDASGFALRGASGLPLVMLDGAASAGAGVKVGVNYIQLSGLGFTNFACTGSLFGSAVRIDSTSSTVLGWRFTGLEAFGLLCSGSSLVDVDEQAGNCTDCEVSFNRYNGAPSGGAGVYIQGGHGASIHHNILLYGSRTATMPGIELHDGDNTLIFNNLVRGFGGPALVVAACVDTNYCSAGNVGFTVGTQITNNTFMENSDQRIPSVEVLLVNGTSATTLTNNVIVPLSNASVIYRLEGLAEFPFGNFNGFYLRNSRFYSDDSDGGYASLAAAQGALGREMSSLDTNPLFATDAGLELSSTAGRLTASGSYVADSVDSPFVDQGDPAADFSSEVSPNGGRVNLGHQGNTAYASYTPVTLAVQSGNSQTADAGAAPLAPLEVTVRYSTGVAPGVELAGTVISGGGTIPDSFFTDSAGIGSAAVTLGSAGTNVFEISVAHAVGIAPVRFSLTGTGQIEILPNPPDGGILGSTMEGRVGCDCSQGSGLMALTAIGCFALLRRKKEVTGTKN